MIGGCTARVSRTHTLGLISRIHHDGSDRRPQHLHPKSLLVFTESLNHDLDPRQLKRAKGNLATVMYQYQFQVSFPFQL
jgi:hypothetical protein